MSKTDFTAQEGEVSGHRLRQNLWIFLFQNNDNSGPSLVLLLLFSNSSLWHCQTSLVRLLLFSKFVSISQITLWLSPWAWTIFSPVLLLQSHFGAPHPPRLPTKVPDRRSELSQATAPMEMIREPVHTASPFPAQISGNSSLPTFGQLDWYEADEASKTLSLTFRAAIF